MPQSGPMKAIPGTWAGINGKEMLLFHINNYLDNVNLGLPEKYLL